MSFANFKQKRLQLVALSVSSILVMWLVTYAFLPYGNHFSIAWGGVDKVAPDKINVLFNSKILSKLILTANGISCDFSFLEYNDTQGYQYTSFKQGAVSALITLYDSNKNNNLNSEQKDFILQHTLRTIEKCDVNVEASGLKPLLNAISTKNEVLVAALLKKGVDVNELRINSDKNKYYSQLYLAESFLKSEKEEAGKQSLIKIIELLKQAGAKSEMSELPAK